VLHDEAGHALERTLFVDAATLSPVVRGGRTDGTVLLRGTAAYNRHGEVVRRTDASGVVTEWAYDEDSQDPRARGNLLREISRPAPGSETDQSELITEIA
jgi:hypothetical protein